MGFISSGSTVSLSTFFTQKGRQFFLYNNIEDVDSFSVGDSDFNYHSTVTNVNGFLPDMTGNINTGYRNVASGTEIRNKIYAGDITGTTDYYKTISAEMMGLNSTIEYSGTSTVSGSLLSFTKMDRSNLDDLGSHLYFSFNLPVTDEQQDNYSITDALGGFSDTAFSGFNVTQAILVSIDRDSFAEFIDGKNFKLTIPRIAPGVGYEVVNCYSTFMRQAGVTSYNNLYSETDYKASAYGEYTSGSTGYKSNIALLFSDSIQKPNGGDSTKSWATGFNNKQPFKSNKELFNYLTNEPAGYYRDEPVGFAVLNKGFAVITHPDIVGNFPYSAATKNGVTYSGDEYFKNVYFTSTTSASTVFHTYQTTSQFSINCMLSPGEFYQSSNPTFDGDLNRAVYITEVGIYDKDKNLLLIAKPNNAVRRLRTEYSFFTIDIKI